MRVVYQAASRASLCPAVQFKGQLCPLEKNCKNATDVEIKSANGRQQLYQISNPNSYHRNQEKSSHIWKNLRLKILTFYKTLIFDLFELQTQI